MKKKFLTILFLFNTVFMPGVNSSENEIYKKISNLEGEGYKS